MSALVESGHLRSDSAPLPLPHGGSGSERCLLCPLRRARAGAMDRVLCLARRPVQPFRPRQLHASDSRAGSPAPDVRNGLVIDVACALAWIAPTWTAALTWVAFAFAAANLFVPAVMQHGLKGPLRLVGDAWASLGTGRGRGVPDVAGAAHGVRGSQRSASIQCSLRVVSGRGLTLLDLGIVSRRRSTSYYR
jgi:hypothetical protein